MTEGSKKKVNSEEGIAKKEWEEIRPRQKMIYVSRIALFSLAVDFGETMRE
jgi:hypothetical protein